LIGVIELQRLAEAEDVLVTIVPVSEARMVSIDA
jgi:hypothetical protein